MFADFNRSLGNFLKGLEVKLIQKAGLGFPLLATFCIILLKAQLHFSP